MLLSQKMGRILWALGMHVCSEKKFALRENIQPLLLQRSSYTYLYFLWKKFNISDNQIHVHHQVFVKLRVVTALPSQSLLKMSFIWLKILIEFLHDQLKFGPLNTNCMPANTGKIAHIIIAGALKNLIITQNSQFYFSTMEFNRYMYVIAFC